MNDVYVAVFRNGRVAPVLHADVQTYGALR
jgi:hypothetical protein